MVRSFALGVGLFALAFAAIYQASMVFLPKPWKRFYNSYVSFSLPPDWSCKAEGTEFVCRGSDSQEARRSIIVLTAKYAGPQDNFDDYRTYLETPKTPTNRDGAEATPSTVELVEIRRIENQDWLVGMHQGSLLPEYKSQYYATISKDIAVLITYSYHFETGRSLAYIGERVASSLVVLN